MTRTICVIGKAKLSVRADTIRLSVTMKGCNADYGEAVRLSAEETSELRKCFASVGFDGDRLKTTSFSIDSKYESRRDAGGEYRQEFVGYEYRHSAYILFDADNALLGRVLNALGRSGVMPEFRLEYTVKDKESVREQLLSMIVADARSKAKCLATAADAALGDVVNINYNVSDDDIVIQPFERTMLCSKSVDNAAFDITPDDITVEDSVTVTFEIK